MSATKTVVFADLTGSTGLFEAFGNEEATRIVTGLTHWIGQVCQSYGGRVVKTLGDGVLALFPDGRRAIAAVVELQRAHERRQQQDGPGHWMQLQIGLDCGGIVEVDGDCYGDAVNVASRLSDLSGGRQIWATDSVVRQLRASPPGVRFHSLGKVAIRGKAQQRDLFRVDWEEGTSTDMMTLPAWEAPARRPPASAGGIELLSLDLASAFSAAELPVHLGRSKEAEFVVSDPRVSRLHARIDWRDGGFVLTDLSSFGTCVRFAGAAADVQLRRDACGLHADGEIALGAEFGDFSVPTIQFALKL